MSVGRLAPLIVLIGLAVAVSGSALFATPAEADLTSALNPGGSSLLGAGGDLLTGNPAGAAGGLVGGAAGAVASTTTNALIAGIDGWVTGSAQTLLNDTASALGNTTSPQLRTTWFSSTYWRMAAIAAVLTLPFLFAAAIQALIRSDVAMLARAAFGYLPLAMLAIAIAAPLTTLLLAACDQLCSFISSAAGHASAHFLGRIGIVAAAAAAAGSPFLAFLVGLFMIAAAFTLWVELLLREAAVYVIVLMLPLGFAAFVWPARRIWAIRAVELLVALILSKFAIVAVLSLGGAAVSSSGNLTGLMAGAVLIMLAALSPWALLRVIPLAELASGAAGPLRGELATVREQAMRAAGRAANAEEGWMRRAEEMRRTAEAGSAGAGGQPPGRPAPPAGGGSPESDAAGVAGSEAAPPVMTTPDGESPPVGDEPRDPPAEEWSERSVLELDREHFDSTPVWPNEDAR
jgi:type IV secretion system protein TrbL